MVRRSDDRLTDVAWLSARRAAGQSVRSLAAELHIDHRRVSAALRRAGLPVPLPTVHVPRLHDVEWLSATLRDHSMADVARMLGCTRQSVRYAARKHGLSTIHSRRPQPRRVDARLADHEWLTSRRAEGATLRELAGEIGISPRRVGAAVRAAGLPPLRRNGSRPAFTELYDVEWVRAQLQHITVTDLARQLGCSTRSAKDAAGRAGVPPRRRQPRPARLDDAGWLAQRLEIRSYEAVAGELGCSVKMVARAVRQHNLGKLARRRRRFGQLYDDEWLRSALENHSQTQIAQRLGCSPETVKAARRRLVLSTGA